MSSLYLRGHLIFIFIFISQLGVCLLFCLVEFPLAGMGQHPPPPGDHLIGQEFNISPEFPRFRDGEVRTRRPKSLQMKNSWEFGTSTFHLTFFYPKNTLPANVLGPGYEHGHGHRHEHQYKHVKSL
jgi:hypothetical protein